jgi:methionine-rich copper-binding protein CopC
MKMKSCFLLLAIGLLLLGTTLARTVFAHSELVRADPAPGASLERAPSEIFAWFSQPLSTGSKLKVFDAQFQQVDKGQTFIDAGDATLMRAQVNPLAPGRYTVNWQANSVDGHLSSGSFDFTIRDTPGISPLIIAGGTVLLIGVVLVVVFARRRALTR